MAIQKTSDASQHVNIFDVADASGLSVTVDKLNNIHVLNRLTANELVAVARVTAGTDVYDKLGNVRVNPATSITYNGAASGATANNVQDIIDQIISGQAGGSSRIIHPGNTTDTIRLPGITVSDKLTGAFPTGAPPRLNDLALISYGGKQANNQWAGVWHYNGSRWINDLPFHWESEHALLTYTASNGQTTFPTTIPDINGDTYTFNSQADGIRDLRVHLNGVLLIQDSGIGVGDYTVDLINSRIVFKAGLRSLDTVQIDIATGGREYTAGAVRTHKLTNFDLAWNDPTRVAGTLPGTVGEIDGSKQSFPLHYDEPSTDFPVPPNDAQAKDVEIFKNGQRLRPDVDYTVSNGIIVFTTAPQPTDVIWGMLYDKGTLV